MAKMVDGKTIKELETRAKTVLYANEYTNGNLLISAEVLLNLIHEVKVKRYHNLPYESKCANLHGHNWKVKIYCKARELSDYGMVEDFTHIKKCVMDVFDHQSINQVVPFNPTAENIAKYICDIIPTCYRVEVQESEGNLAIYEQEDI